MWLGSWLVGMSINKNPEAIWKLSYPLIFAVGIAAILIAITYSSAIRELLRIWGIKEEYSYGYMIPFVTAFLVWQRKDLLGKIEFSGAWLGVLVVVVGFFVYMLGEISTLYLVIQYSLVIMIMGLALAMTGWKAFKVVAVPLLFLAFMIPLPQFFLAGDLTAVAISVF